MGVTSQGFSPILDGEVRNADPGCSNIRCAATPPYTGTSGGFTACRRRCFAAQCYAGIELEMKQATVAGPASAGCACAPIRSRR